MIRPWLWLPLVTVAAGVLVASALAKPPSARSATARIGLTSEVVWPYYDATRARILGLLTDDVQAAALQGAVDPAAVRSVELVMPETQSYIDVTVTADDAEVAARGADAVARSLVALDHDVRRAGADRELATAEAALADANAAVDEFDTQIDDLRAQAVAVRSDGDEDTATGLDDQVRELLIRRDQLLWNQSPLIENRLSALLAVARDQPEVEVLSSATVAAAQADRRGLQQAFGAIAGTLVGLFAAWAAAARFGRIRSATAARELLGVPVEAVDDTPTGREQAALFLATCGASHRQLAVVGSGPSTDWVVEALDEYESSSEEVRLSRIKLPEVIRLGDPSDTLEFKRNVAAAPGAVVVLVLDAGVTRLSRARALARSPRDGRQVAGAMLIHARS